MTEPDASYSQDQQAQAPADADPTAFQTKPLNSIRGVVAESAEQSIQETLKGIQRARETGDNGYVRQNESTAREMVAKWYDCDAGLAAIRADLEAYERKKAEAELKTSNETIRQLQDRLGQKQRELNRTKRCFADLESQIIELREDRKELKSEVLEVGSGIESLNAQLESERREFEIAQSTLIQAQSDLNQAQSALNQAQEEARKATNKVKEVADLRRELATWKTLSMRQAEQLIAKSGGKSKQKHKAPQSSDASGPTPKRRRTNWTYMPGRLMGP
ncbi:hypothetical protein LTR37_014388 [Vermiconidia calcicola]|uniref:Uncharacterized protein n=1 Tax=Vermiconidia calcicola TaxID=1690605 RepID=A0ACC3MV96_9PEZI|nr:hypothetical protein LTR37_014388 [Vermiconidia calcicola]